MWQCHFGLFWSLHFLRVLAEPLCDPIGRPEGGVYLSGPQGTGAQISLAFLLWYCRGLLGGGEGAMEWVQCWCALVLSCIASRLS